MTNENELTKVPHHILQEAEKAGMEPQGKGRSGTFFHMDQATVAATVNSQFEGKIELMDIKDALKKYSWLEQYRWKIVDKNKDEFTKFEDAIKKQPPNSLDELKIVLANYPSAKWYYRLPTVMRAGGDEHGPGQVEANDVPARLGERHGVSSGAAADVERTAGAPQALRLGEGEQRGVRRGANEAGDGVRRAPGRAGQGIHTPPYHGCLPHRHGVQSPFPRQEIP